MSKNIEETVITWLESTVDQDYKVFGDQPNTKPDSYILVDRTGGPRESMVLDQAEILIEVYHKTSRLKASRKADDIADIIHKLLEFDDNITRAVVNSVVNLDDTIAQYHRYQIYCDIYNRR